MPLASMTGFARAEGAHDDWTWVWEARSVNGRGLDIRLRLPPGLDAVDQPVRKSLQARFARGNVNVTLQLERRTPAEALRINEAWLGELMAVARRHGGGRDVDPAALLGVRGVVELVGEAADPAVAEARDSAVLQSFEAVADGLQAARGDEGRALAEVLGRLIGEIEALLDRADEIVEAAPEGRRERLKAALAELLALDPPISEERLAQELALQLNRADVREELDRLRAHVDQARELIGSDDPVGRRFDFLAQEFNREANTLCSKAADVALTRTGMELKVAIDRLREQVQNVE